MGLGARGTDPTGWGRGQGARGRAGGKEGKGMSNQSHLSPSPPLHCGMKGVRGRCVGNVCEGDKQNSTCVCRGKGRKGEGEGCKGKGMGNGECVVGKGRCEEGGGERGRRRKEKERRGEGWAWIRDRLSGEGVGRGREGEGNAWEGRHVNMSARSNCHCGQGEWGRGGREGIMSLSQLGGGGGGGEWSCPSLSKPVWRMNNIIIIIITTVIGWVGMFGWRAWMGEY